MVWNNTLICEPLPTPVVTPLKRKKDDQCSKVATDPHPTIFPKLLNILNIEVQYTIHEKKSLSKDKVVDKYLSYWYTIEYHGLEI